ncbi:hypothetical protein BaRGS_00005166, partial [Batillaria attramentaria]
MLQRTTNHSVLSSKLQLPDNFTAINGRGSKSSISHHASESLKQKTLVCLKDRKEETENTPCMDPSSLKFPAIRKRFPVKYEDLIFHGTGPWVTKTFFTLDGKRVVSGSDAEVGCRVSTGRKRSRPCAQIGPFPAGLGISANLPLPLPRDSGGALEALNTGCQLVLAFNSSLVQQPINQSDWSLKTGNGGELTQLGQGAVIWSAHVSLRPIPPESIEMDSQGLSLLTDRALDSAHGPTNYKTTYSQNSTPPHCHSPSHATTLRSPGLS